MPSKKKNGKESEREREREREGGRKKDSNGQNFNDWDQSYIPFQCYSHSFIVKLIMYDEFQIQNTEHHHGIIHHTLCMMHV